jgi:hypothetical protein
MSQGALTRVQRIAIGQEPSIYGTPASFEQIRGIEGVTMTASRESLADNRQLTSQRNQFASHIGQKSFTAEFTVPVHNAIDSDLDAVFTSVMGAKLAQTPLSFVSGTVSAITVSAGDFDSLILISLSDGRQFVRPVLTASGLVGTLAIKLPSLGLATVVGAQNADANSGSCYVVNPLATPTTMQVQIDRDVEPDQVPFVGKGCIPTSLAMSLDLTQRLSFTVGLSGGDWSQEIPAQTATPAALENQLIAFAAEAYIQDIGTPTAGVQLDISSATIEFAPQFIARNATRYDTSTSAIPGSAIVGYTRGLQFVDPISVTLTLANNSWLADRTNKTPFALFLCFALGVPGQNSNADRLAIYFPRVVLDADPTYVDIDGVEGMQLSLKVEQSATLSGVYTAQASIAFFKA